MTADQLKQLREIRRLLKEAYDDYFERSEDGHCKNSEGYIEVRYANYFDYDEYGEAATSIGVYSYVLGPSRMHDFGSFEHALTTVREWHRQQLASVVEVEA